MLLRAKNQETKKKGVAFVNLHQYFISTISICNGEILQEILYRVGSTWGDFTD